MKLRYTLAIALGAMMMSQSASALSCMRPDLMQTVEEAISSDKVYYILKGRFIPDKRSVAYKKPPRTDHGPKHGTRKAPTLTRTWFEGHSVAHHPRADVPLRGFPVDIETSCMGPWCGSSNMGNTDVIAFVQVRYRQPPLLTISPCPKWVFSAKTAETVQTIRRGLRD